MNTVKSAIKVWMSILVLGLILLPGTAMAENEEGTGSSATSSLADFLRPVTDWFRAGFDSLVSGPDAGEPQRGAGSGTGEPQRGAGNGTGEPQRSAGSGTGEPQRGAGNGTGEPQRGAGNGTGEPQRGAGKEERFVANLAGTAHPQAAEARGEIGDKPFWTKPPFCLAMGFEWR